jgi:eukaryotic-like serine/threonine-protein kinase
MAFSMSDPIDREVAFFSAARRLAARERAAYLDEACAGNAALRQRVEELLRASEEAGGFLQEPAPGAQRPADTLTVPNPLPNVAAPGEKAGDRIGRYKLLQQIGEGGCGVVYMAEQEEPVRRRVALKVIKLGMDTKQVIARFEAERQALALMDHPNIAKVLEAGATDTGRPYFVMELVRGIKITHYCDENHLSTEARLDLFIQVAKAVQHAHQKGIIHRDLKPSNILVADHDGVPVPKIIDFGIAKATTDQRLTDKTLFTAFEQFIGTPAYMSPEQARMSGLDIDTRTDIYSLGVLLYELLTSKTPFDAQALLAAGLDEMRRTISEQEPATPSTRLTTMLESELTTTAKHRHTEAPKLVHRIRGDLDWIVMKALEKERARRYETANGLATDIQRHLNCEPVVARPPSRLYEFQKTVRRHKFGFAATGAVIAALLIGLAASMWLLIRETADRRRAEAAEHKAQTEAAKSQQVAQFLKEMLRSAEPDAAAGQDTTLLHRILDNTVARVTSELSSQPEVQGELLYASGMAYWSIYERPKAAAIFRQAEKIQRKVLAKNDPALADTLFAVAEALMEEGRPAESEALFREALQIRREVYGDEHLVVAGILNNFSGPLAAQGKLAEAESVVRQALAIKRKLLPQDDPEVAISLRDLGLMLRTEGNFAQAEDLMREALAMFRKTLGGTHTQVMYTLEGLAAVLRAQGKITEAEHCIDEALQLKPKLYGSGHWKSFAALGDLQARHGRFAEAAAEYAKAIELSADADDAWYCRAISLFASGQLEAYRDVCHQSLQRFANTTDFATADRIAKDYLLLPGSGPDLQTAARMIETAVSANSNHQYSAWFQFGQGLAEYRQGRYVRAADWMQQVLERAGPLPERDAAAWLVLAMAQHQLKQADHARASLIKGREIINATMPTLDGRNLGENWDDWVIDHALLRETKALIRLPPTTPKE